jgi:hypothetical protein
MTKNTAPQEKVCVQTPLPSSAGSSASAVPTYHLSTTEQKLLKKALLASAVPTPSKPECDYETGSGRWMEYALFLEGSLREAERKLAVREGWVMVPVEPTQAMLGAFNECKKWLDSDAGTKYKLLANYDLSLGEPFWKVMVNAALDKEGK